MPEMIVVNPIELSELTEQIKKLNENITNIKTNEEPTILYTRTEVMKKYDFSDRAVKKLFTEILKDKVVYIGKEQKLSKRNIEALLEHGVRLK